MNLTLTRPLVFFDIEATGLNTTDDRIIDIALYKKFADPSLKTDQKTFRVNPGMPIPPASTEVHGITDADVADCPFFEDVADDIYAYLEGCDVAGFGCNHFDIPMLYNSFARAGLYWNPDLFDAIDVGNIFKIKESRTLSAAVQFYCGYSMQNAHQAMTDTLETAHVFSAQLERYDDLPVTVAELARFSNHGRRMADISGKFNYTADGVLCFNFGPHRNLPAADHPEYLEWMYYKASFPEDTRSILRSLLAIHPMLDNREGVFGLNY